MSQVFKLRVLLLQPKTSVVDQVYRSSGGVNLRIGEAQGGSPLRLDLNGAIQFLEAILGEEAVMADVFDLTQTAVGLKALLPQCGQVEPVWDGRC